MNGIGGKTIEEAKERMTYDEFLYWVSYRQKFGSLNPGRRTDLAVARLCVLVARAASVTDQAGNYFRFEDFLPQEDQEESPEFATDDDIIKAFMVK